MGIYSVAVNLSGIVPQIVFALAVVVAPKLTKFKTNLEAKKYLTKVQIFVLGFGVVGIIVGSALSFIVIPLFYGQAYIASIYPLIVLLIAQAIFLISIPAHTAVIYYFAYPKLFVWISAGHFLIILLGGYFLIWQYGYMGAASTVLLGSVFNFLVPFVWALNKFKEK